MPTQKIDISSLPTADQAVPGDFFVIEDGVSTERVNFENIIWGLDNVNFASTISAQSTNIATISSNFISLSSEVNSNVNALDNLLITSVQALSSFVRDMFYPIGNILYTSLSTNPAVYIPGTSWQAIAQGKFIAGVGQGVDKNHDPLIVESGGDNESPGNNYIIGETNHILTVNELPPHSHNFTINLSIENFNTATNQPNSQSYQNGPQAQNWRMDSPYPWTSVVAGSGSNHNNCPPLYGIYVWQRTS